MTKRESANSTATYSKIPKRAKVASILDNTCSCFQGETMCHHLKKFRPQVVICPHSAYYLSNAWFNDVLASGAVILVVAHVYPDGTEGHITERLENEDHQGHFLTVDAHGDPLPPFNYQVASWSCKNQHVTMRISDDKVYEHDNFMPALWSTSNITTKTTVTQVYQTFYHDNMRHYGALITGTPFVENDFNKDVEDEAPLQWEHLIQVNGNLDKATPTTKKFYVRKGANGNTLIRVLHGKTRVFHFRLGHFSLFNLLFKSNKSDDILNHWKVFTRQFALEEPGMDFQLDNEIYNSIYQACYALKKFDFEDLDLLHRKCVAYLGASFVSPFMVYVLMREILVDVIRSKVYIYHLSENEVLKNLSQFPFKKNFLDKVADYFLDPTELTTDLTVKKEKKVKSGPRYQDVGYGFEKVTNQTYHIGENSTDIFTRAINFFGKAKDKVPDITASSQVSTTSEPVVHEQTLEEFLGDDISSILPEDTNPEQAKDKPVDSSSSSGAFSSFFGSDRGFSLERYYKPPKIKLESSFNISTDKIIN